MVKIENEDTILADDKSPKKDEVSASKHTQLKHKAETMPIANPPSDDVLPPL